MSIWLWIALCAYFSGVLIEWQRFQTQIKPLEEYSNFPIVWVTKQIVSLGYLLKALFWFYSFIYDDM
jgi:hypothetical protein